MYEIEPPAVYLHERALATPEGRARIERMLAHVRSPREPQVVDDARLNDLSLSRDWPIRGRRTGEHGRTGDPDLIFNAFTWDPPEVVRPRRERYPGLAACMLDGAHPWTLRQGRDYYSARGTVCQTAWELHSAWGCLHRCDYCHVGGFLNIMVNLEELADRLRPFMAENPWLRLYKYDNQTDTIAFEPEYGASALFVPFFAATEDRFLMLYTKSDNVEHLMGLDHGGHTIVSFTISCPTTAREIEKATPDTARRIAALARVQEGGYVPRVRFSPIVPLRDWREENEALIRDTLTAASPDVISMDVLGWMNPDHLDTVLDASLLDPRFLEAMRVLYRDGPPGPQYYPSSKHIFPHDLRVEVYTFFLDRVRALDRHVRVALCNETTDVWRELGPRLGMTPENYVCGCGPDSVPSNPLLAGARPRPAAGPAPA